MNYNKITGSDDNKEQFEELRKMSKLKIKSNFKNYIQNLEKSITTNTKSFWSYINKNKKIKGYPKNLKYKQKEANESKDIANLFSQYFKDVGKYDNESEVVNVPK